MYSKISIFEKWLKLKVRDSDVFCPSKRFLNFKLGRTGKIFDRTCVSPFWEIFWYRIKLLQIWVQHFWIFSQTFKYKMRYSKTGNEQVICVFGHRRTDKSQVSKSKQNNWCANLLRLHNKNHGWADRTKILVSSVTLKRNICTYQKVFAVRGNLVISNGDISLGDFVFSDGDLN